MTLRNSPYNDKIFDLEEKLFVFTVIVLSALSNKPVNGYRDRGEPSLIGTTSSASSSSKGVCT